MDSNSVCDCRSSASTSQVEGATYCSNCGKALREEISEPFVEKKESSLRDING